MLSIVRGKTINFGADKNEFSFIVNKFKEIWLTRKVKLGVIREAVKLNTIVTENIAKG